MNIHHLRISWATSRGRDTCGYSICRLDDSIPRTRYRCVGGGYDMIGTVLGKWLSDAYQEDLKALAVSRRGEQEECGYSVPGYKRLPSLYGLTVGPDGRVSLDGACGVSSMLNIAEAIGLEYQWEGNRKGHTIGYFFEKKATP